MKLDRISSASAIILIAMASSSCSPLLYKKPATPEPHAFISYKAPAPGTKALRLGVKDLIDMKGEVTSAGSEHLFKKRAPARQDAECLRLIRQRKDVVIVGKTNLSEFAVGVSGSNDYFGTPVNPIDRTRVPGGSSSGSASAVGLGLADITLGTDTAGSIRVPAACCGIAGLKTTFGLISTKGVYPISPTYLDTVGPMAKDVSGLVQGMELLQDGFGSKYARAKTAKPSASAIRIGRLRIPDTDPAIDRAIDARLEARGFKVVPLGDDFLREWLKAQRAGNLVAAAATWKNNQHLEDENGVNKRAKVAISFGKLVYALKYKEEEERQAAIARRNEFQEYLKRAFKNVDAIALPVLREPPPKLNYILPGIFEGRFMKLQTTMAPSYAGFPALALPVPMEDSSFPVTSIQLVGLPKCEAELLNIGRLLE